MEITEVEAIPISVPLTPLEEGGAAPYIGSGFELTQVERLIVRIETTDGVTGWGELRPELGLSSTKHVIEQRVAPQLIGRPVWGIEKFVTEALYTEYVPIEPFLGGVEMAMWDALGKHLDAPLHQLLGGKCSKRVEFAEALGILSPAEAKAYAQRSLDRGFDVLKIKGGKDWRDDVERVKAIYDQTGDQLDLRIDPNQAWAFEEAIRVGASLEREGIYLQYLEQPIRIDTVGTYKRLRNRLETPICVNEDTYHSGNLFELIKHDAIDVAVVDMVPTGGILAVKKLVALAAEAGVSVAHHCGFDLGIKTAAILHTVSSSPGINLPSDTVYHALDGYILTDPFELDNGTIEVPNTPGLGITVDRDRLETYRVEI